MFGDVILALSVNKYWRKSMTPQGRKIWGSKEGQSLMESMLKQTLLTPEQQETVRKLKESSKAAQPDDKGSKDE